ncbi:Rv2175c family DNA-binding protein [Microvirga yunnanensis]
MRLEWLLVPDDALEGLSPLETLREGRIKDVIDVARVQGAE